MALVPQVIPLTGSTASGVAIDSTGDNYDGESRLSWPFSSPNPYADARLVVGADATQTDAEGDLILRDYQAGSDVATISGVDLDDSQFITEFDPDDLDGIANIGLRVSVTSASGTADATADFDAKVILRP